ncbi:MAG: TolC family protein [Epsilonproteobacteria bacterium]|nr:hypothetical protein [Campylobacterota bacterium]NPA57398.1 TolC family protein [Campylobacterota bacterium]
MRYLLVPLLIGPLLYGTPLDQVIEIALQKSPILKAKRLAIEIGQRQREAVTAESFGKVDLGASYTHYNIPRTLKPLTPPITPSIPLTKDLGSLNLKYEVALFTGFAQKAKVERAVIGERKSRVAYRVGRGELIYRIKSLYFQALALREELQALEAEERALQELQKSVSEGVAVGRRASLELLKVKSGLLKIEAQMEGTRNGINSLHSRIEGLIGAPFGEFEPARERLLEGKGTPPIIAEAELEKRRVRKELKMAESLKYPKLIFQGIYGKNFGDGREATLWQTTLNLNYTLLDFGYRRATYERAKVATLAAEERLRAKRLEFRSQVEEGELKIASLKRQIEALRGTLKVLEQVATIEKVKYESGRGTIDDYLQALADLQKGRSQLAQTRYQLFQALAYLNYLKGGE